MKKSEISSSCERLFAGEAIVEPEARDAAIAWIPDTMRFLDTVTADDADAGVDDQSDVIEPADAEADEARSEEHTTELQSLMRISYAVFCLKKKKTTINSQ